MVQGMFVQFSAFEGPSMLAPFPAAVAELDAPAHAQLPAERIRALLAEYLPDALNRHVQLTAEPAGYVALAAALAAALQDLGGPCELPMKVQRLPQGRARILLGYHDVQTALHALRGGLEIARALLARVGGGPDPRAAIATIVERASSVMVTRQPDPIARALMRAARGRGIPVYPVAPGSRVWQYGQGSASIQFYEAANQHDSGIGARLAADRFMTNQLIRRLGLPGVDHELACAFRMDALGIDFMTPDISRSWREVPCAVLEIHATPGFSSDSGAELIIDAKFPAGGTGRIPSAVLIGAQPADCAGYADTLRTAGLRVGETDGRQTRLDGRSRCLGAQTLPARVMALLLDPGCDALVIGVSVAEIERHGFPLDRCELAVVAPGIELSNALRQLVDACAREAVFCGSDEALPRLTPTQVAALAGGGSIEAYA